MNDKQKALDEYAEFLLYNGFDLEGLGFELQGLNINDVKKEKLQKVFDIVDEINKKTQEFKSKFNDGHIQPLKENEKLNKKLEIAVASLKKYAATPTHDWIDSQSVAKKALTKIDEVEK